MVPDYLVLRDERRIRIEINFNALTSWSAITGADLQQLKNLNSDMKLLRALLYCGAAEGEACDGRELGMSEEEFGRICGLTEISEAVKIIVRQLKLTASEESATEEANKKK